MSSINYDNGSNTFDPTKKVKDILGEDFVNEVEKEALEKLSSASKTAVRSHEYNTKNAKGEENMFNPKDILNSITHSTTLGREVHQNYLDQQGLNNEEVKTRKNEGLTIAKGEWAKFTEKKSAFDRITNRLVGVSKNNERSENIKNVLNVAARGAVGFVGNNFIETFARAGDKNKMFITAGASSLFDVVASMSAANTETIGKFFDENCITKADFDAINSTIRKEKIKYGIEHAACSFVLPTLVKYGVDRALGDKMDDKLGKILSFGTFSTIGRLGLMAARFVQERKLADDVNIMANETDTRKYYTTLAKAVTNKTMNTVIDPTIVTGIAGSIHGFNSVSFVTEDVQFTNNDSIDTSNILAGVNDINDDTPTIAEVVERMNAANAIKTSKDNPDVQIIDYDKAAEVIKTVPPVEENKPAKKTTKTNKKIA